MHNDNEDKKKQAAKTKPGPDDRDLKGKKVDAFPDHEEDRPVEQLENKDKDRKDPPQQNEKKEESAKAFREGTRDDNIQLEDEPGQITNQDTTIVNEEEQQKKVNKE